MGKTKSEDVESPNKRHKKHKKHRHNREASSDSFSFVSSQDGSTVTSPQPAIKLKIKIGGQTFSSQRERAKISSISAIKETSSEKSSYTVSNDEQGNYIDVPPGISHCEEVTSVDWNESQMSLKKEEDTSDEEREWLDALEAGELDDNGELKKAKDTSLLTTRQKALLHGERIEELQELAPVSNNRPTILTEEQIKRRQMRAKRRREQAQEKTEKDKQETLERLLKKQDSKIKTSNKALVKERNVNIPVFRYTNNSKAVTISVPTGYEFPFPQQLSSRPKPVVLCGVENCQNSKRYSCSKTGIPLCSIECYRKNLTFSTIPAVTHAPTAISATT